MARHVYTVVEAFRSVGPSGVKDYLVGDEVVLDRPARPGRHLQLVRVDEPAAADAQPAAKATTKPTKA